MRRIILSGKISTIRLTNSSFGKIPDHRALHDSLHAVSGMGLVVCLFYQREGSERFSIMKNKVLASFLLVIIILSFGFSALRLLAQGSEDNFFNREYRQKFAEYKFLRKIFALNHYGDAKSDYLDPEMKEIVFTIDQQVGTAPHEGVIALVKTRIANFLGKEVLFIAGKQFKPNKNQVVVKLMILKTDPEYPDTLGSTKGSDTILVYYEALLNFTRVSPETLDVYTASTILHEFAHLLGLEHNNEKDCLMNEHTEPDHIAKPNRNEIITDFCDYEKDLIKQAQML